MGKASSSKKVARAAKVSGRPGAKKNFAWPAAIGAVVILGVVLVVLSFGGKSDAAPPRVGDHWHAAYGMYDCDHFLAPFTDKAEDAFGIHTHGEGLMHIHPFTSRVTGANANINAFLDDVGAKVTDTSFQSDASNVKVKNGDKCQGQPGHMELWTWTTPSTKTATVVTKNIGKFAPKNGNVWVIAFVKQSTKPVLPQSAANLQDPLAAEQGRSPAVNSSTTSVPAGASTTSPPPPGGSSTSQPAPPSSTP